LRAFAFLFRCINRVVPVVCMLLVEATAATAPLMVDFEGELSMMARLPYGRLITMYTPGRPFKESALDGPEQPVYLRFSSSDGNNWSKPQLAFSYPAGKGSFSQKIYPLVDRAGHIHAFNVRYYRFPKRGTRDHGYSELMHAASHDAGKTWSVPNRVDFGHDYTGAINSIIQLKNGRILVALSYMSDRFVESAQQFEFRSVASYSDDDGRSWTVGADNLTVPPGPLVVHPGAIEPILMELKDGRVWMIIRTQTLRFYESFSRDEGKTWSTPAPTKLMAPDSPGAILRLSDGRLLLVWNDVSQYPITGNWRQYLYGALSSDEGRTWSASKRVGPLVDPDTAASRGDYPFLCEAADKSVLLIYSRFGARPGATYEHPHMELIRLDPEWVGG
jgi:predicted neuraminidase